MCQKVAAAVCVGLCTGLILGAFLGVWSTRTSPEVRDIWVEVEISRELGFPNKPLETVTKISTYYVNPIDKLKVLHGEVIDWSQDRETKSIEFYRDGKLVGFEKSTK